MKEDELLSQLRQNPFVLAPMAGITDCAFRSFMKSMGASIVVTELVSATGLRYSSQKTKVLMRFEESQRPIGIQLFGEDLDDLTTAAEVVEQMGADFVDLNFGCPVPKVVKKGAGSAVLKDLGQMKKVLRATKKGTTLPVTIKIRTGWDELSKNSGEVAQLAFDEGITWIAIHGRTRAAAYTGKSDWEYIAEVKQGAKLPIIGNGDIHSAAQAVQRLSQSKVDAVMIGRGCLKNPWIFQEANSLLQNSDEKQSRDFMAVLHRLKNHLVENFDDRIVGLQLKKFAAWFSHGYPDSSAFRKQLFAHQTASDTLACIDVYFQKVTNCLQKDTSHEPFLMGGHG